jgi:hypothetical protein
LPLAFGHISAGRGASALWRSDDCLFLKFFIFDVDQNKKSDSNNHHSDVFEWVLPEKRQPVFIPD